MAQFQFIIINEILMVGCILFATRHLKLKKLKFNISNLEELT
jgi:hypothetical protein